MQDDLPQRLCPGRGTVTSFRESFDNAIAQDPSLQCLFAGRTYPLCENTGLLISDQALQAESAATAGSMAVLPPRSRGCVQLVIPESPREPAESSITACTHSPGGRISSSQPPGDTQAIPSCPEDATDHVGADKPLTVVANPGQSTAAVSNMEVLSKNQTLTQSPHLQSYTVPSIVAAGNRTEDLDLQAADNACQPAEFDIVVDAHPAGKSICSLYSPEKAGECC